MKSYLRTLLVGALCLSNLMVGTTTRAETADLKQQNDEILARGGVLVFVSSLSLVSAVFGMGFKDHAEARSKEVTRDLGKFSEVNSAVTQQIMIGADPGDVVRFEFMPKTQQALLNASDDMKVVADAWIERIQRLEARNTSLLADIQNLKDDFASLAPESRPPVLSATAKAKRIAEISRDLEDTKSLLRTAHLKAGEARANSMTTHGNYEYALRTGTVKPIKVVMEIPIEHKMPMKPEVALSRILAPTDAGRVSGAAPSVRILRFDARNTNQSMQSARIAKRGFIGLAAGVLIAVEEITVGVIGAKMAERSAEHFAPEARIEPKGYAQ